jgi:hypothetical protein
MVQSLSAVERGDRTRQTAEIFRKKCRGARSGGTAEINEYPPVPHQYGGGAKRWGGSSSWAAI